MKAYNAGPFFIGDNGKLLGELSQDLHIRGIEVIDPSLFPLLEGTDPVEKARRSKLIFELNSHGIASSDVVFALIDDRDPGTLVEIGIAHGINMYAGTKKPVFTWSGKGFDSNIMLRETITAHYLSLSEMLEDMDHIYELVNMYQSA